ncbi:hypothetical protein K8I85_17125, partial [bacterium]|nr:hypothetical protein [bacterium]
MPSSLSIPSVPVRPGRLPALLSVLLSALILTAAAPVLANTVTHDLQPLGAAWGAPFGNVPGDFMFTEDSIDLSVHRFWSGGVPCCFNFARIDPEITDTAGGWVFGSIQTLQINNVNVRYDFTALPAAGPDTVRFEWLDLGGTLNVDVNGAGLVEMPDWPSLHLAVLPGGATVTVDPALVVPVDMNADGFPDGRKGVTRIEAPFPIDALFLGGQEYWVDRVHTTRGGGGEPDPCPVYVGHEFEALGKVYGAPVPQPIGAHMYTESLVELYTERYVPLVGGPFYNQAQIDSPFPAPISFGTDAHILGMNNMDVRFKIGIAGVTEVTFDWLDLGGTENLSVNGAPLWVGELDAAPAAIAPGVLFSTTVFPVPGGKKGTVTLTGPVAEIVLGGQEFWHDNMCVRGAFATGAPEIREPAGALGLELGGISPNPFRGGTRVAYSLERAGAVSAVVYDLAGRRVRTLVDRVETAGSHTAEWDGRDSLGRLAVACAYFVRLHSADE